MTTYIDWIFIIYFSRVYNRDSYLVHMCARHILVLISEHVSFETAMSSVMPVSRIEFTIKSSVYWPIIGLGTST